MKTITISDVARLAEVSPMTVSRYINNSGYVGEKTAGRIKEAIESLDYHPNRIAKSLVTKKTNTAALVIASVSNPFYPELILGAEDVAYEMNTNVFLCNLEGKGDPGYFARILFEQGVDGIVFSHLDLKPRDAKWLTDRGITCSLIDNETPCPGVKTVTTDDEGMCRKLVDYFVSIGHQKIALIMGPTEKKEKKHLEFEETFQFNIWKKRTNGFLNAMKAHWLEVPDEYLVLGGGVAKNNVSDGYRAMQQLLALPKDKLPTAVFCENDLMAVGAYNASMAAGYSVPGDFSIAGFDGISLGEYLYPRLTTIAQPQRELGAAAMRQALDPDAPEKLVLDAKLIIGGTTAPPKK